VAKSQGVVRRIWTDHPAEALMLLLVAMIFSGPLTRIGAGWLVSTVAALLPLAAVFALGQGRTTLYAGLLLGLPAVAAIVQADLGADLVPEWVVAVFPLSLYVLVTVIIVRGVMESRGVASRNTILGAISGYLMLGYVWSIAYQVVASFAPQAFRGTTGPDGRFGPGEAVYYSFVTLTTMGYGEIVPVAPMARSLSILEAVTGIMYIAVLVAAVIGSIRD
jgi:voltage-gated potassium channel